MKTIINYLFEVSRWLVFLSGTLAFVAVAGASLDGARFGLLSISIFLVSVIFNKIVNFFRVKIQEKEENSRRHELMLRHERIHSPTIR